MNSVKFIEVNSVVLVVGMSVLVQQEGREEGHLKRNFKDCPNI